MTLWFPRVITGFSLSVRTDMVLMYREKAKPTFAYSWLQGTTLDIQWCFSLTVFWASFWFFKVLFTFQYTHFLYFLIEYDLMFIPPLLRFFSTCMFDKDKEGCPECRQRINALLIRIKKSRGTMSIYFLQILVRNLQVTVDSLFRFILV